MGRNMSTTLQETISYDDCLISSCLKKMFTRAAKSVSEPSFIIGNKAAEFKKEIELLNKEGVLEISYPYLEAMERSLPDAAFRYVVIYRKNTPVLFGYFQLYVLTSENFDLRQDKSFIKGIVRFFLDLKKATVLMSGNALRTNTAWYCYNETVLNNVEAIEVVASAAEKIADQGCVTAVILKDMSCGAQTKKWLAGMGYTVPLEDLTMAMDIDRKWETLTDYIAALSRKYRTRAHKILAAARDTRVRALSQKEVAMYEPQINGLFENVADNQAFVLARPGHDHFSSMKKVYKDDFEVVGFFRGEELVAFYSAFVTEDAYELYYVGFDYTLNSDYQLYFNILFSGLGRTIALKKKHLKLGRTSFDAKASMGAKPVEMSYFIKIAKVPNVVINWFANYFSSMEDGKWKLRNPLG